MKKFILIAAVSLVSSLSFASGDIVYECKADAMKRAALMAELDYFNSYDMMTKATTAVIKSGYKGDGAWSYENYTLKVWVTDTKGTTCGKVGAKLLTGIVTVRYNVEGCELLEYKQSERSDCDEPK